MAAPQLLALDTASLYFRAFYGMPTTLRGPDGRPVNAVRGLADFIARFVEQQHATHLVCAWDNDWRPGWRVDRVPTYKTHRLADPAQADVPPVVVDPHTMSIGRINPAAQDGEDAPDELAAQVPLIVEMLATAGIVTVGADHCEADDVLGTLARTAPMPVAVVTGDRDLLQLVDDERGVTVVYTARGISKSETWDEAKVVAEHGVLPSQYADYALLRGDASDGLPGVAGIGAKSAQSLLHRHGDLEGILAAASDPAGGIAAGVRAKLAGAVEYLAAARDVVRVVDDLPSTVGFDELVVRPVPDEAAWAALCERVGLGGAGERLAAALARAAG